VVDIRGANMSSKKSMSQMAATQCRHIKPDRSRCRANALHSSPFCFFHDPKSAADRAAARRNGGRERSRRAAVLPADTSDRPLASAADVTGLLAETINQVRRGEIDPRISNAVGYLAGILLKARERDEMEQRLARLESIVARQPADPKSDFTLDPHFEAFEFVNPESGGQA
jgi:hypothetical protein